MPYKQTVVPGSRPANLHREIADKKKSVILCTRTRKVVLAVKTKVDIAYYDYVNNGAPWCHKAFQSITEHPESTLRKNNGEKVIRNAQKMFNAESVTD